MQTEVIAIKEIEVPIFEKALAVYNRGHYKFPIKVENREKVNEEVITIEVSYESPIDFFYFGIYYARVEASLIF